MLPRQLIEKDTELTRLARCEAQLKLRIGECLDALFARDGHRELGFSSLEAYVLERCERSGSWARDTRGLARRLRERGLEEMRRQIFAGTLSWSMADLLARHATRENEEQLLASASTSTVREMRKTLTGRDPQPRDRSEAQREEAKKLHPVRWVNETEHAMLAASRKLIEYLTGTRANDDAFMTAILGETETSLQTFAERRGVLEKMRPLDAAPFEKLVEALGLRAPIEAKPKPEPPPPPSIPLVEDRSLPTTLRGLDGEIRRCCRELARRNLEMGRLSRALLRSQAWRGLGYASAADYATERVGMSLSSLEHKATLARRLSQYPLIAEALNEGVIGYEAALQISRVVGLGGSDALVKAWIDRARCRTIKHLGEDVDTILGAVDVLRETSRFPPTDEDIAAARELERKILSGELMRSYYQAGLPGPQMSVTIEPPKDSERHPMRMTLSADVFAHWRRLEADFHTLAGCEYSFIGFMCASLWTTWLPMLLIWDDKWKEIYQRDGHRCSSPVCNRRDVTLHHIHPKGLGGSDDPENLSSPCSVCHIDGIHVGRLDATGPASKQTWKIGRDPIIIVNGRERIAVSD